MHYNNVMKDAPFHSAEVSRHILSKGRVHSVHKNAFSHMSIVMSWDTNFIFGWMIPLKDLFKNKKTFRIKTQPVQHHTVGNQYYHEGFRLPTQIFNRIVISGYKCCTTAH